MYLVAMKDLSGWTRDVALGPWGLVGCVYFFFFDESWGHLRPVYVFQNDVAEVVQIQSTKHAFAALRSDGQVVVWGHAIYGGELALLFRTYFG